MEGWNTNQQLRCCAESSLWLPLAILQLSCTHRSWHITVSIMTTLTMWLTNSSIFHHYYADTLKQLQDWLNVDSTNQQGRWPPWSETSTVSSNGFFLPGIYEPKASHREVEDGWMNKHKGGPWPQSSFSLLYTQPLLQNSFCSCLPFLPFPLRALQTPRKTVVKDLANADLSDPCSTSITWCHLPV